MFRRTTYHDNLIRIKERYS